MHFISLISHSVSFRALENLSPDRCRLVPLYITAPGLYTGLTHFHRRRGQRPNFQSFSSNQKCRISVCVFTVLVCSSEFGIWSCIPPPPAPLLTDLSLVFASPTEALHREGSFLSSLPSTFPTLQSSGEMKGEVMWIYIERGHGLNKRFRTGWGGG